MPAVRGCPTSSPASPASTAGQGPPGQGQPHRRRPPLRPRPRLHLPERRRPRLLCHPLRARLHADRHDRRGFHRRSRRRPRSTRPRSPICSPRSASISSGRSPATTIRWTYSGVRPLYDDGASEAQAATRDYRPGPGRPAGEPPLLSVFGGKITTYRRLAEHALEQLRRRFPTWAGRGPRTRTLPGGDIPVDRLRRPGLRAWPPAMPFLDRNLVDAPLPCLRHARRDLLAGVRSAAGLGRDFGAGLTEREVDYLSPTSGRRPPRTSSGGGPNSACASASRRSDRRRCGLCSRSGARDRPRLAAITRGRAAFSGRWRNHYGGLYDRP